ncbi:MAG: glycosyltransferase [Pseudomonadota bacterium]
MKTDATIVLNVHRESVFLRRTLLSLNESASWATDSGLTTELIVVLDRTDQATRDEVNFFQYTGFASVRTIEVNNGSLGPSRNDGISIAGGDIILTADADDLVSRNYIYDMVRAAQKAEADVLYFPEYLLAFGDSYHSYILRPLRDVTPLAFIDMHPYISRVCAHRSIYENIKYADLAISRGYAFEDWHFNAECLAAGCDFRIARDVILFYRQRSTGLLKSAKAKSVGQIPATSLFKPTIYKSRSDPWYKSMKDSDDTTSRAEPADKNFWSSPFIREELHAANNLEPSILIGHFRSGDIFSNASHPLTLGLRYYDICQRIDHEVFDEIFLFPFISRGGAEKFMLALIDRLYRDNPLGRILIILGENLTTPCWDYLVPPNATIVDLGTLCPDLTIEDRCILTLKLIQGCAPSGRIHMRQSVFVQKFLDMFAPTLSGRSTIFYRFADSEVFEDGKIIIKHSPLGLLSDHIDFITTVVCDSELVKKKDQHRIGLQADKWRVLRASVEMPLSIPMRDEIAERRILWASRLDAEKRPSLIPLIAKELQTKAPELMMEAYGGGVFQTQGASLADASNFRYRGPYNGFQALPLSEFSIFIYTSWCDGIPNVLLEAMSWGMVIIAPDVGGISEIIIDGETGVLLRSEGNDDDMAKEYVKAILRVARDSSLRASLSAKAIEFVRLNHSREAHAQTVHELFGGNSRGAHGRHG